MNKVILSAFLMLVSALSLGGCSKLQAFLTDAKRLLGMGPQPISGGIYKVAEIKCKGARPQEGSYFGSLLGPGNYVVQSFQENILIIDYHFDRCMITFKYNISPSDTFYVGEPTGDVTCSDANTCDSAIHSRFGRNCNERNATSPLHFEYSKAADNPNKIVLTLVDSKACTETKSGEDPISWDLEVFDPSKVPLVDPGAPSPLPAVTPSVLPSTNPLPMAGSPSPKVSPVSGK